MKSAIITGAQIRAARALLDWSRDELADKSGVSLRSLVMIEADSGNPRPETLERIRDTLLNAGIKLVKENGGGYGVRFRKRG